MMVSPLPGALLLSLFTLSHSLVDVPLSTAKGPIIGFRVDPSTSTGASYDAFVGVPYGQIPARFQLAEPRDPWTTPLYTQKDGPECPQPASLSYSEDCLYINVFTPVNASAKPWKLPVMVYIHGSGFTFTSSYSGMYGPDFLVPAGVVLVTMNYRLGAVGFLTLGSEVAPGNLGLQDTLLALQWVRDEISVFGGDPSQVTLFGQSAGSVMAQFHYLSPLSTDLFTKVIAQSGSVMTGWALVSVAEAVRRAKLLAQALQCDPTKDDAAILACLQAADIKDIVGNQTITLASEDLIKGSVFPFVPVVDSTLTAAKPFFNDSLADLMQKALARAKPMMTGFTTEEGIFVFGGDYWRMAEDHLSVFLSPATPKGDQSAALVGDIQDRYFPDTVEENKVQGLVSLYTDTMFAYPSVQVSRYFANLTYGYLFTYEGSWAPPPPFFKYKLRGVTHGDDVAYLFYRSDGGTQFMEGCTSNLPNLTTMKRMVRWWTNFAKTGTPDSSWEKISNGGYQVISTETLTMNVSSFEEMYFDFWAGIEQDRTSLVINDLV